MATSVNEMKSGSGHLPSFPPLSIISTSNIISKYLDKQVFVKLVHIQTSHQWIALSTPLRLRKITTSRKSKVKITKSSCWWLKLSQFKITTKLSTGPSPWRKTTRLKSKRKFFVCIHPARVPCRQVSSFPTPKLLPHSVIEVSKLSKQNLKRKKKNKQKTKRRLPFVGARGSSNQIED